MIYYTHKSLAESLDSEGRGLTSEEKDAFAIEKSCDDKSSFYIRINRQNDPYDKNTESEFRNAVDRQAGPRFKRVDKDIFDMYISFIKTNSSSIYTQISQRLI